MAKISLNGLLGSKSNQDIKAKCAVVRGFIASASALISFPIILAVPLSSVSDFINETPSGALNNLGAEKIVRILSCYAERGELNSL
ncbi:MAG: hypothetical protein FWC20_12530 [Oscillospiraceae bacterium]|nr:hypothetical protein [Oscillospiraceae bacterium]MCL2280211.1 hypothetical protein [Oscillospiraceae bacterium]